jgi:hypothetical protein
MQGRVLLLPRSPAPVLPRAVLGGDADDRPQTPLCAGEHGCTGALFVAPWLLCSPAPLLLRSPAQEIAAGVRE